MSSSQIKWKIISHLSNSSASSSLPVSPPVVYSVSYWDSSSSGLRLRLLPLFAEGLRPPPVSSEGLELVPPLWKKMSTSWLCWVGCAVTNGRLFVRSEYLQKKDMRTRLLLSRAYPPEGVMIISLEELRARSFLFFTKEIFAFVFFISLGNSNGKHHPTHGKDQQRLNHNVLDAADRSTRNWQNQSITSAEFFHVDLWFNDRYYFLTLCS